VRLLSALTSWTSSCTLLALVFVPPVAGGTVTPDRFPFDPVLSGDRAVWFETTPAADVAVVGARAGEPPRRLQAIARDRSAASILSARIAASPALVLAGIEGSTIGGGGAASVAYGEVWVGAAAGPLERIVRCEESGGDQVGLRSVDASGAAYVYRVCDGGPGHVEVRDTSANPLSPARSVGSGGHGARIAGRYVAWLENYSPGAVTNGAHVVVYDRVADGEVYRLAPEAVPGPINGIDLQGDGTVALAYGGDRGLAVGWASPSEPRLHPLGLAGRGDYDVRIARDRIAFQRGTSEIGQAIDAEVGVSDLRGNARIVARHTDDYYLRESFDFDGRRVLWRNVGCTRVRLVVRSAAARTAARQAQRRCPLVLKKRPSVRAGVATFGFGCPALRKPCRFYVVLRAVGSRRVIGSARFGRRNPVRIRLTSWARRRLAARGALRVRAKVEMSDRDARLRRARPRVLRLTGS
jgi:hypothetical protein